MQININRLRNKPLKYFPLMIKTLNNKKLKSNSNLLPKDQSRDCFATNIIAYWERR